MLRLNRYAEEAIVLMTSAGERVRIVVCGIERLNGRPFVRLAIEAPLSVEVLREELIEDERKVTR